MSLQPLSSRNDPPFYYNASPTPPWKAVAKIRTLEDCFGKMSFAASLAAPNYAKLSPVTSPNLQASTTKIGAQYTALLGSQTGIARTPSLDPSLESMFGPLCLQPVNCAAYVDFPDYLTPNERGVAAAAEHLKTAFAEINEPGYLIGPGTFRMLFAALLAPTPQCKGVIGRDINPRVKAVIDFEVLLLRIAKNRDEYYDFSCRNSKEIRQKLASDPDIPPEVKRYYQEHFDVFSSLYYDLPYWNWRTDNRDTTVFKGVEYYFDDVLFGKLQSLAKSGNIIATVGSLSDLASFKHLPVAAIDMSNIQDYTFLNFKWPHETHIIWTDLSSNLTQYFSHKLKPMSGESQAALQKLLIELTRTEDIPPDGEYRTLPPWLTQDTPPFYCNELLTTLQHYGNTRCIHSDKFGWISGRCAVKLIREMNIRELHTFRSHPEIYKIVPDLVGYWAACEAETYTALSKDKGWQEAFQREVQLNAQNRTFIEWLRKNARHLRAKVGHFPEHLL